MQACIKAMLQVIMKKKCWSDILNRNYLSTGNNEIKVPLLKISNLTWQYPRKIQRLLVDVFSRGRLDSKQWTAQAYFVLIQS